MTLKNFPEFSRLISISNFEAGETSIYIEASLDECNALANRFEINNLHNLSATLKIANSKENKNFRLDATYSSKITQLCVLTLKPIINIIEGNFSSTFTESREPKTTKDYLFNINDADPPEFINNGSFDAGELVSQYLSLEIDPFPRSANANLEDYKTNSSIDENEKNNPFSVLKKLKSNPK